MTTQHATVRFGADTTGFRAKLQRMTGMSRGTVNTMMGIFAGFSIRGVFRQFSRLMDQLDEIGKKSAQLGVTTKQFQQLDFAAGQMGATTRDVETAISRMSRTLSDAERGQARANDALDQLNISYQDLIGLDIVDQFQLIGDSVNRVTNQQRRLNLAQEFFGRSGRVILDMSSNYEELAKQAESVVIGEEHIKAAEDYNDAIDRMGKRLRALAVETGAVRGIAEAADYWTDALSRAEKSGERVARTFGELQDAVGNARMEAEEIDIEFIERSVKAMFSEIDEAKKEISKIRAAWEGLDDPLGAEEEAVRRQREIIDSVMQRVRMGEQLRAEAVRHNEALEDQSERQQELEASQARMNRLFEQANAVSEQLNEILREREEAVNDAVESMETQTRIQQALNDGLEFEAAMLEMIGLEFDKLTDKQREQLQEQWEGLQRAKEAAEEVTDELQTAAGVRVDPRRDIGTRLARVGGIIDSGMRDAGDREGLNLDRKRNQVLDTIARNTRNSEPDFGMA